MPQPFLEVLKFFFDVGLYDGYPVGCVVRPIGCLLGGDTGFFDQLTQLDVTPLEFRSNCFDIGGGDECFHRFVLFVNGPTHGRDVLVENVQ
ncbi:MAG: hypothetical protein HKN94_09115 [Acidimicrobiales bacterium]|nr:hypothetical protein [Acidimicrobiales bacterium]